jgi:hypothetical protein
MLYIKEDIKNCSKASAWKSWKVERFQQPSLAEIIDHRNVMQGLNMIFI